MQRLLILFVSVGVLACGSKSPTNPSPTPTPPPTPTPTPVATTLTGTVTSQAGARISGATVTFLDGPNAGKATSTDGNGTYRFEGLQSGNANLVARANGFEEARRGDNVIGAVTMNFTLRTAQPFTRSGSGDTVFELPTYITRVRIQASTNTNCQNFAVKIAGRLVVNVIIGTCSVADARTFDGTYTTSGGTVETQISTGVNWTFTEVR